MADNNDHTPVKWNTWHSGMSLPRIREGYASAIRKLYGKVRDEFALRISGNLVIEHTNQENIFEILEELYEPEFTDFSVEFWNEDKGQWEVVISEVE